MQASSYFPMDDFHRFLFPTKAFPEEKDAEICYMRTWGVSAIAPRNFYSSVFSHSFPIFLISLPLIWNVINSPSDCCSMYAIITSVERKCPMDKWCKMIFLFEGSFWLKKEKLYWANLSKFNERDLISKPMKNFVINLFSCVIETQGKRWRRKAKLLAKET